MLAARSADNTYTVYAQVQLTSPNDPALQPILASIGAVPGANPGEVSPPATPAVAPTPVPATLLHRGRDTGEHDGHRRDGPAVGGRAGHVDRRRRRPRSNDDFSQRPRVVAAPDRNLYFQEWDAEGLELWAFPYRPDPYTLLVNRGWAGDCDDGGVQSLDVRGYSGLMQTWSNCGGTGSRIVSFAVSPADQSATSTSRSSSRPPTMRRSSRRSASFAYDPTA